MSDKVYLILFADGTFATSLRVPEPEFYQKGARFFECSPSLTVADISELSFQQFDFSRVYERVSKKIREIK